MKRYDRQSTRALHTGSKQWRLIREKVISRDEATCRMCKRVVADGHVDHIRNDAAVNAGFDLGSLQYLCSSCHSHKSAIEASGGRWRPKGCDDEGWPVGVDAKGV